jgi:chromate transport protein ChrA
MSYGKFLVVYLLFMAPTYIWRWVFAAGAMSGESVDDMASATYVLLAISYAVMIYVTYRRGIENQQKHLVAFPAVGAFFDIVLGFIPFVPTVLNILALVLGAKDKPPVKEA